MWRVRGRKSIVGLCISRSGLRHLSAMRSVLSSTDRERTLAQIAAWRNDLISMSRRNKLLYFSHTKASSLELTHPGSSNIIRLLDSRPHRLDFYDSPLAKASGPGEAVPGTRAREPKPNEIVACVRGEGTAVVPATPERLRSTLRTLRRAASQEYLDKGLRSLYLAIGMLRWFETPEAEEPCFAPLLLVPVELQHEVTNVADPMYRLLDEDPVINPALAIKLEEAFGLRLPNIDEYEELDVERLQRDVRRLVSSQARWSVEDRVVLGRFAFHKDVMYRDLVDNEDAIAEHDFVRALVDNVSEKHDFSFDAPSDEELDEVIVPEQMYSILDADSSQRKCIWAAVQGNSFAMDGPPGTGKSQTIANMIGELIARGKTVLFVSEKAAALEVVHKRLKAQGLHEYVLQLHSHEATRREVAQELGRSLERRPTLSKRMPASSVQSLTEQRKALSAYAAAMNVVRKPLGRSLHSAIGRLTQLASVPSTDVDIDVGPSLKETEFRGMLEAARKLGRAWGPVERGGDFVWRDTTLSGARAAERQSLDDALRKLLADLDSLSREGDRLVGLLGLPRLASAAKNQDLVALLRLLEDRRDVPADWLTQEGLERASSRLLAVDQTCASWLSAERSARAHLGQNADLQALGGAGAQLYAIVSALGSLRVPIAPESETPLDEIEGLRSEWGKQLAALGDDLAGRVANLCRDLGVETQNIDFGLAEEFFRLPCLTEVKEKPEANWLDEEELETLHSARRTLGAMVSAYRSMYETVRAVFNDEILRLPVEDIALRFDTVHRGLGILRPAYRRDKKTLRSACRLGRVTREAIAMLGSATQLKILAGQIAGWEQRHAAAFGAYYAHKETDFAALDHALASAEIALQAAARRPELRRALRHVARGAEVSKETRHEIGVLRERLANLARMPEILERRVGERVAMPCDAPLGEIVSDFRRGHELLGQILDVASIASQRGARADSIGSLLDGLNGVDDWHQAAREMEADALAAQSALGHRYAGFATDVEAVRADLAWCDQVIGVLWVPADSHGAQLLLQSRESPETLSCRLESFREVSRSVCRSFTPSAAKNLLKRFEGQSAIAQALGNRLLETLDDIVEWREYAAALEELGTAGLSRVAEFCCESGVPFAQVAEVFERRILESWADAVIAKDKTQLAPLRAVDRDSLVQSFREFDQELVRFSAGAIMEACNARRPKTALGTAATIQREAQKKARHMPIRNLLSATKDVAQSLKPCFMMSPLSVSQFLGPHFRFDAVIFDEASQIRPHDAINCLYRGGQHIIAGDLKQLPPTSFFDAHADDGDEWVEDQIEQFESILEKVKGSGVVPDMALKWHYRSLHEDLITFSNYRFYDGQLITFPSPKDAAPPLGVGLTWVPGVYRRGAQRDNLIEARKVAEMVALYCRELPELSIGVVAFSQAQQDAIENAIDELRMREPSLPTVAATADRLDGLFVKNLETVQGDERDVIILSVGYGPDENGKLTMAFGPINSAGGFRRLNVAVTRARYRVEVVASIRAGDINESSASEGVRHLRKYLEYAENGPRCLAFESTLSLGEAESPFEAEVARTIRSWGYEVVPQVGSAGYRIDLGVRHAEGPGGFAIGVECDGSAYHSSKTARDRDRLRESVLRGLGWELHRIWGTSWYRQRQAEEKRLRAAIELAVAKSSSRKGKIMLQKVDVGGPAAKIVIKDVALPTSMGDADWVVDYKTFSPKVSAAEKAMPLGDPGSQPTLRRAIPEIVRVEQPVHISVLQERLLEAWDAGRAGSRIQENIEVVLRRLVREKEIQRDKAGFTRLAGCEPIDTIRRPVAGDSRTHRTAQQVPLEEYVLAVKKCQELAPGITHDDLSSQVATLFGWGRRGREIAEAIDAAINAAEKAAAGS
jgi:very-short-patch-repair endonuclease